MEHYARIPAKNVSVYCFEGSERERGREGGREREREGGKGGRVVAGEQAGGKFYGFLKTIFTKFIKDNGIEIINLLK